MSIRWHCGEGESLYFTDTKGNRIHRVVATLVSDFCTAESLSRRPGLRGSGSVKCDHHTANKCEA